VSLKIIVNGIDVGRQGAADGAQLDPPQNTLCTEWLGGTQTRTLIATEGPAGSKRQFTIDADYPYARLGSGVAPSPDDLFLASLGSSFVTSFVLAAAAADVRIESMRVLATRAAFAGLGDRGTLFADLELHGEVDADASPAHLEQLVAVALERSPVVALSGLKVWATLERVERSSEA
jgi:uncharacterized OsmC-like protein